MYSGSGFKHSELGDVDVIKVDNVYHLFHLILPNHDYIAHAISTDGCIWRRVKNALFIGDPGTWDDDMLWTMHVSKNPEKNYQWRMFYTGISRKEMGRVQRIGIAYSNDLYKWEKCKDPNYPLSIEGPHYEKALSEGRHWVSCRDPFFYNEDKQRLLLLNARVPHGPVVRRGCVGIAREISPNQFQWLEPLFFPRMYDDIEVPCLYKMQNKYYLFGNIREDTKVHYWYADHLFGPYEAFCDNVLLPKGNYAARITKDDDEYLVWNFFISNHEEGYVRLFPPPKSIYIGKDGFLKLKSFSGFDKKVISCWLQNSLTPLVAALKNPAARSSIRKSYIQLESFSGYEIFFFKRQPINFRMRFRIRMQGVGKTGIICKADENTNGYYISLDLINGFAQIRAWGQQKVADLDKAFYFDNLQTNHFPATKELSYRIQLICYGGYIELSIDGRIILSLVDTQHIASSRLGLYLESAKITLKHVTLEDLDGPSTEDYGPV